MSLTGAIRENTTGDIDVTGTAITVHCWTRPHTLGGFSAVLVNRWGTTAGSRQFLLQIHSAQVVEAAIADAAGTDLASGATTVTFDAWHCLGLRKNGTGADALQAWLDGAADASVTSNRSAQSLGNVVGAQFRIGIRSASGSAYDGLIADVAIWLAALTDGEMQALAKGASPLRVRPKDLYHYWPLYNDFVVNDFANPAYTLTATGLGGTGDPAHAPVGSPFPVSF